VSGPQLRAVAVVVTTAWRADRSRCMAVLFEVIASVTGPLAGLWLGILTNGILAHSIRETTFAATMLALSQAVGLFGQNRGMDIRVRLAEETGRLLDLEVVTICARLPGIGHHQQPDIQDRMQRLRDNHSQLAGALNMLVHSVRSFVTAAVVLVTIGVIHPVLLVLVVFALPAIPLATRQRKRRAQAERAVARHSRLARELRGLAYDPGAGMEARVFGYADRLVGEEERAWEASRQPLNRAQARSALLTVAQETLFTLGFLAATAFMVLRAAHGQSSVGEVITTVYLCRQVQGQVTGPVNTTSHLGTVLRTVEQLIWLRDYAEASAPALSSHASAPHSSAPERIGDGIRLENVSFHYPDTERLALKNVTAHIPVGSVLALVGPNGAGKSTLIGLLTGMYSPTSGRILLDGRDLMETDLTRWREHVTAVYQDFARFELTASQAIGIGDVPYIDSATAVDGALRRAGVRDVVDRLPDKESTQLGARWPKGIDLSTGQWQHIALARGAMRPSPQLSVFDEPTASLDAHAEHRLFTRFADLARQQHSEGGITILVTHRFSTVQEADTILVLDDGEVVEHGTHGDLLRAGGRYAHDYHLQSAAHI
jgi:ATP-binding cassette, subfamily B, bacterial